MYDDFVNIFIFFITVALAWHSNVKMNYMRYSLCMFEVGINIGVAYCSNKITFASG